MFGLKSAQTGGPKRISELTGANDVGATGVLNGIVMRTPIATAMGWRVIELIDVGDQVMTFDMGLQCVTKVTRTSIWNGQSACPTRFWPLEVPPGVLGNRETMHVLPQQNVMVESDAAEEIYGDPFSLLPASSLEGVNGIHRAPPQSDLIVVTLHFDQEQVVFAGNGALFFCPSSQDLLQRAIGGTFEAKYSVLPHNEARVLAETFETEVAPRMRAPAWGMAPAFAF